MEEHIQKKLNELVPHEIGETLDIDENDEEMEEDEDNKTAKN
jgi:hypothetical protein